MTAGGGSAPPNDPAELARDIERTRERLGDTVEALAAKANVKAQAQRKAREISGRAKAAGTARAQRAVTTLQRRPEVVAAAIAAAAWAAAVALWRRDSHG